MSVSHDALQEALNLANTATSVAMNSPHVSFTLCINNLHELEASYNSCKAAVVAAYNLLADAILDLDKATELVKAAEAKEAKVKGNEAMVAAIFKRYQAVADEYTADSLKIKKQMEDLIEVREEADKADFAILASLMLTPREAASAAAKSE